MSAWQIEGNVDAPVLKDLGSLVGELKKRLVDSSQGREAGEVVRALIAAWGDMDGKEPDEKYGKLPNSLLGLADEPEMTDAWEHTEKSQATRRIADAGPAIAELVQDRVAHGARSMEYYFYFETEHHHFGVYVSKGRWTVCEPEHFGVVRIDVADLGQLLGLGFLAAYNPKNDDGSIWSRPANPIIKPEEEIERMNREEKSEYYKGIADRQAEIREWREARNALKITFEMKVHTRRGRR
ncbi:hypothetical protein [Amycolatopsis sp. lyj-23]|uniref:hypothetical protein n=1 Tax=Amycolatopsis sp. lyj-23 TaxID=2789283 RepID=UPI00397D38C7